MRWATTASFRRAGPRSAGICALVGALLLALLGTLLGDWPAYAAERQAVDYKLRATQKEKSVPGTDITPKSVSPGAMNGKKFVPSDVSLPDAGTVTVPAASTTAKAKAGGGLPVKVMPTSGVRTGHAKKTGKVDVTVLSQKQSRKAHVDGVLLQVQRADGGQDRGAVRVQVDYGKFADAYGGDWASRLTLMQMPACAHGDVAKASCGAPVVITGATNDPVHHTVTAEVAAAADDDSPQDAVSTPEAGRPAPKTSSGAAASAPSQTPAPAGSSDKVPVRKSAAPRTSPTASATDATRPADTTSAADAKKITDTAGTTSAATDNAPAPGTLRRNVPVLLLAAVAAGPTGSFQSSSLSSSQAWAEGGSSGAFTYAYPVSVPEAPDGDGPDIALSYNSQAVDGHTSATNSQASWIGDGWDFSTGFVERSYQACSEDMGSGANNTAKNGDLCWGPDVMTLSLGGASSRLVKDAKTGQWHPQHDSGEKVEHLTGAVNGADGGEYWKVTTTDGTQYFFGQNQLPGWSSGKPVTNSTWTVPVAGNNAGEPGHATAFADSFKQQAWRWNLDYVVDPGGNASSYWYTAEHNNYGKNMGTTGSAYNPGGYLNKILYGQRSDALYSAQAPDEVDFTVAERCVPATGVDCTASKLTKDTAKNWPDVPFDQICADGAKCTTQHSPAFFSRKRLTTISTKVLVGSAYKDVDSYALDQSFPQTGDGMPPPLWLKSVTRTGKDGTAVSVPPVTFSGTQLANRVDGQEGLAPMVRWRVGSITTETGEVIAASYSAPDCTATTLPTDPAANTTRCFPQYWTPDGALKPIRDWFHKYVVTRVIETDNTGGAPGKETAYEYIGAPAWHFDANEMAKAENRTWSEWRGYGTVRTLTGSPQTKRLRTDTVYFRGMDGDRTASGGTRSVSVADSEGNTVTDADPLAGSVRETLAYDGENGKVLTAETGAPTATATASRTRSGLPDLTAWMTGGGTDTTRTLLSDGTWRRTKNTTKINEHGEPVEVDDAGDTSITRDDLCTRTTYAENTAQWRFEDEERVETVATGCATTPSRPDQVVTDTVTSYDSVGNVSQIKALKGYDGATPQYTVASKSTYDVYGRELTQTDAAGAVSKVSYTPATGANPTGTTDTDELGNATTLALDPARDLPLSQTDPNGKRTDATYDALGRTTAVWTPGRAKDTATPSVKYSYTLADNKPSVVTTSALKDDGTYSDSTVIYDALLRARQTQSPAAGGGRVNEDDTYDSRGLLIAHNGPYYNDQPVSGTILAPKDNELPRQIGHEYDGAGRETASILYALAQEKWRTTTTYSGDVTTVIPPKGATVTSKVTDARGRTVEQRQYHGAKAEGAYDATNYTYTPAGDLATTTDAAGNVWSSTYDVAGRQIKSSDPDAGETTYTYDDAGQVTSTTDARGKKLSYTYDDAGRQTAEYAGDVDGGTKIASWQYDTLAKGALTSSTRYQDGRAYTQAVTGYNDDYSPTGTTTTVPAEETGLAGTYTVKYDYTPTGELASESYGAAGGLKAEKVVHSYDADGLSYALTGLGTRYVSQTSYSPYGEQTQLVQGATGGRVSQTTTYDETTRRVDRALTDHEVAGAQGISDIRYRYDDSGQVLGIQDTRDEDTAKTDNQCFQYDYLGRTTEAWTAKAACADANPTPTTVGGIAPYWHSYTYDVTGNRTSKTVHDTTGSTAGDIEQEYTYNKPGTARPHALTKVTTTKGPGTGQERTYAYDENGNTTSRTVPDATGKTVTQTLDWDDEGHLADADTGGNTTSYVYDASGSRLISRGPQGVTLDLGDEQFTYDPSAKKVRGTRYYSSDGEEVAMRTANDDGTSTVTYLVSDHHGTATTQIDAATLAVTRRELDEFGNDRVQASTPWLGDHGFVGGRTDATTGLTQLGARPYDPDTGRFLSADPVLDVSSPQQLNAYAYANNAPATLSDPEGTWWGSGVFKKVKHAVTHPRQTLHKAKHWVKKHIVRPAVRKVKKAYHKYAPKKLQHIVHRAKTYAAKTWHRATRYVKKKVWPAVKRTYHSVRKRVTHAVRKTGQWTSSFAHSMSSRSHSLSAEAAGFAAGLGLTALGAGEEIGGIALDLTGVGAIVGVGANVAGAATMASGIAMMGVAGAGAASDIAGSAGEATEETSGGESAASDWREEYQGLRGGSSKGVKEVDTTSELRNLFDRWTEGAKRLPSRGDKVPDVYELGDGTKMQWRTSSHSGGETIDIFDGSKYNKVHLPKAK